jgi:anti-sigma B factor antagonist
MIATSSLSRMDINKTLIYDTHVLNVSGKIDAVTSRQLESAIDELLKLDAKIMLLDLREVEYVSSSGLRVLMVAKEKLRQRQGNLRLASLQPLVREVFEITGLKQFFAIYPSQGEALKDMMGKS